MPVDQVKIAQIVKRIQELKGQQVSIPNMTEVKGIPGSSGNANETDHEHPLKQQMPSDIGPVNDQTISGTGHGPPLTGYRGAGGHT